MRGLKELVPLTDTPSQAVAPCFGCHWSGDWEAGARMSFIVQCLCVCPAAPRPHLPSLLITAHYGEVKQINQKTLSQSLPRHTLA